LTAHSTFDFVTVLCNKPKAFASDLVNDLSRYLWWKRLDMGQCTECS